MEPKSLTADAPDSSGEHVVKPLEDLKLRKRVAHDWLASSLIINEQSLSDDVLFVVVVDAIEPRLLWTILTQPEKVRFVVIGMPLIPSFQIQMLGDKLFNVLVGDGDIPEAFFLPDEPLVIIFV